MLGKTTADPLALRGGVLVARTSAGGSVAPPTVGVATATVVAADCGTSGGGLAVMLTAGPPGALEGGPIGLTSDARLGAPASVDAGRAVGHALELARGSAVQLEGAEDSREEPGTPQGESDAMGADGGRTFQPGVPQALTEPDDTMPGALVIAAPGPPASTEGPVATDGTVTDPAGAEGTGAPRTLEG